MFGSVGELGFEAAVFGSVVVVFGSVGELGFGAAVFGGIGRARQW